MSDILIKNMEMPKSCYSDEFKYCPFLFFDYDTKSHCELSDDIRCTKTRRPKGCPLVELPSHGRLVDADKILTESGYDPMMFQPKYGGDHRTQYDTLMGYEILGIIEDAQTVVEASTNGEASK